MSERISIPDTGLSICPIGLGTVQAGISWKGAAANRIFDAYVDHGGNMIDSARVYAGGHSEEVVGDWLSLCGKRQNVIIVTKGGHPKYDSPEDDLHISRMSADDMRCDLESSLRALKTDYIDIYFYHRDNRAQTVESEIEVMERFVREGKIRYYACSNWDADRIEEADRYCAEHGCRGFVADQSLLNIGSRYMNPLPDDTLRTIKGSLYDYHVNNSRNLAMPYMGVAGGFFHKYLSGGADAVKNSPYDTAGNRAAAERCRALTEKYNASLTQVLLGFFTQQPFRCAPLYGPKDEHQIIEALASLNISFSAEDYII